MKEYLEIGSGPADEECPQVGDEDYGKKARIEISAFINQLKRVFPEQFKTGITARIKSNQHDFGTYYETAIYYDSDNEKQVDAAFYIENNTPGYWDKIALKEMTEKGHTPSANDPEIAKAVIESRMIEIKKKYPHLYENKWEKPSNYGGAEYWDYFGVIGQHRDSDIRERSNFEVAKSMLEEAKEEAIKKGHKEPDDESWIEDTHAGHWAVGWVDHLLIHFNAPDEILAAGEEILKALEQYPLLDDEHYSNLEHEELHETWYNNRDDFGKEVIKVLQTASPESNFPDYRDMDDKDQEKIDVFTLRILEDSSSYSGFENAWVNEKDIKHYFQGDGKYEAKDFKDNVYFQTLVNYFNPGIKKNPSIVPVKQNPCGRKNSGEKIRRKGRKVIKYTADEIKRNKKDSERRNRNLTIGIKTLLTGYSNLSLLTAAQYETGVSAELFKYYDGISDQYLYGVLYYETPDKEGNFKYDNFKILDHLDERAAFNLVHLNIDQDSPKPDQIQQLKKNPTNRYIATAHISNTGGIGITKIEHDAYNDEQVHWEIVTGDKVLKSGRSELYYDRAGIPDENLDDVAEFDDGPFFDAHGSTWSLQEFIRT